MYQNVYFPSEERGILIETLVLQTSTASTSLECRIQFQSKSPDYTIKRMLKSLKFTYWGRITNLSDIRIVLGSFSVRT